MKTSSWLDWLDYFLPHDLKEDTDSTLEKIERLRKAKIIIKFSIACFFSWSINVYIALFFRASSSAIKDSFSFAHHRLDNRITGICFKVYRVNENTSLVYSHRWFFHLSY